MLIPSAVVGLIAFGAMGVYASQPSLFPQGSQPTAILPVAPIDGIMPFSAGKQHIEQVVYYWENIPGYCQSGEAVNQLQAERCSEFWDRVFMSTGIAAAPLGAVAIFFWLSLQLLAGFYKRSSKKIKSGKALCQGIVTTPALAPRDIFSWIFCLNRVSLQVQGDAQIQAYLPLDVAVPLPGETMTVFSSGKGFGRDRKVASHYAPHLAIVAGIR